MKTIPMTKPIHRYKKVGKYIIKSYLSIDEVHVTCTTEIEGVPLLLYYRTFKTAEAEEFTICFDNLALIAEIKTSLNK